jgi:hypothetical protein
MNYYGMIESYLYGSLPPEDEIAFERQLDRDPELVVETSRRLNGGLPFGIDMPSNTFGTQDADDAQNLVGERKPERVY